MKINKFCTIFLSFLIFLSSCASVKEGLVGSKRSKTSDEFLVQKKNPLVLPPGFEDLPLPSFEEANKTEDSIEIKSLLKIYNEEIQDSTSENSGSLEKSVLKKIKNK